MALHIFLKLGDACPVLNVDEPVNVHTAWGLSEAGLVTAAHARKHDKA